MINRDPLRFARHAALFILLLALFAGSAAAVETGAYSLEILVDGMPLEEHAARGKRYVEALAGREYSLRLTNRTPRRIAVALAVDGLNTVDAKTSTSSKAAKWILGPYGSITIDGWQTGSQTARHFFFTSEEKSYGAWLGKTQNLGVISAAVYRERLPQVMPYSRSEVESDASGRADASGPMPSDRPAAGESQKRAKAGLSEEMAATGIGREQTHRVRRVAFESESSPAATMQLRYEYHDALVRLGVLPRVTATYEAPLSRRERAAGFEDFDFAPDPFHRP